MDHGLPRGWVPWFPFLASFVRMVDSTEWTSIEIGDKTFFLSQSLSDTELQPIFSDAWTGSKVWDASIYLSNYMMKRLDFLKTGEQRQCRLIELGSGCGLCGMVACSLGAEVTLTDQSEMIDLLNKNMKRNFTDTSNIQVEEFYWGDEESNLIPPYNYILVSDCINPIYGMESWRKLAKSIYHLSDKETITFLCSEERGDNSAMRDFLEYSKSFLNCQEVDRTGKISILQIVLQ